MIRCGKLCKSCRSTCHELPTTLEPIEIECTSCLGEGCDGCDDGYVNLEGCPQEFCGDIVPALDLIDLFEKGLPPIAGGTMDQTVWFLEASRRLRRDERELKGPTKADQ